MGRGPLHQRSHGAPVVADPVEQAGADVLGFQSKQWAENYLLSARSLPELRVMRGGRLDIDGRVGAVRSFPVAVSAEPLRETANRPEADRRC